MWLKKLTAQFRRGQSGLVLLNLGLLNLGSDRQAGRDSNTVVGMVGQGDKRADRTQLAHSTTEPEGKDAGFEGRERAKAAAPAERGTCTICGGDVVIKIVTYWRDRPTPDAFAPADIIETCLSCQRVVTRELPPP